MAKLPTKDEIEKAEGALQPYHLALGKVAHAWNHMQEQLGLLFSAISGVDDIMGMAIWHALKSDRSQRDLLQAAVGAAIEDEDWREAFPAAKEDIDWLIKKVNSLTDGRNSAIHAPVFTLIDDVPELRPYTLHGNPNAAKLQGKDILAEFAWYENYFFTTYDYALNLTSSVWSYRLQTNRVPWPDRPLLPTVGQRSARQVRNLPDEIE